MMLPHTIPAAIVTAYASIIASSAPMGWGGGSSLVLQFWFAVQLAPRWAH